MVAGPIVGSVLLVGPSLTMVGLFLGATPFVYVAGLVPATVTGAVAAVTALYGRLWLYLLATMFCGGLSTVSMLATARPGHFFWKLAGVGMTAAAICAVVCIPIVGLKLHLPPSWAYRFRALDPVYVLLAALGAASSFLLAWIIAMILS